MEQRYRSLVTASIFKTRRQNASIDFVLTRSPKTTRYFLWLHPSVRVTVSIRMKTPSTTKTTHIQITKQFFDTLRLKEAAIFETILLHHVLIGSIIVRRAKRRRRHSTTIFWLSNDIIKDNVRNYNKLISQDDNFFPKWTETNPRLFHLQEITLKQFFEPIFWINSLFLNRPIRTYDLDVTHQTLSLRKQTNTCTFAHSSRQ